MPRRRQSPLPAIAAIVLAVAFAVSLYANWSLATTGKFELLDRTVAAYEPPAPEPAPQPPMETILVPARDLEPFHLVSNADFYNEDGSPSFVRVRKDSLVGSTVITNAGQAVGRVLMRAKSKGTPFHPSEFFPEGTRPGLSAGLAEGMRGIWVDCRDVRGLDGLQLGDEVELVATATIVPVNPESLTDEQRAQVETIQRLTGLDLQAQVRRVAERAQVVHPVRERDVSGSKDKVAECYLALMPREAAALESALLRGEKIKAVAVSGRIDGDDGVLVPEVEPVDPLTPVRDLPKPHEVEVINGGKSTKTAVDRTDG